MRAISIVLSTLLLSGCATFNSLIDPAGKSVLEGGASITASVQNPITRQELYQIENAYGVVLVAANTYRRACSSKQIDASCRSIVARLQGYNRTASGAIRALRGFVRNNDTVNAVAAFNQARAAIAAFQAAATSNGVN